MSSELTTRGIEFPSSAPEESGLEILTIFWRRKLIVLLFTAAGLGLGYLFFLKQTPVYSSSAQVLIIKDRAKLPIEGLEMSSSYDRTHEQLIRSPLVIEQAVKNQPELVSLASLSGAGDPAGRIINGLKVTGDGGKTGDILKLEYESLSRDDCPVVLNAVVAAYQNFLGNTYKKEGKETAELIGKAKDELEKQIKELKERYAAFQKRSPLLTTGETSQNVHQTRLQKIEELRSENVLNNSQLLAQVAAIEAALQRGSSREALNLMVGKLTKSEEMSAEVGTHHQTIEERIFPLMLQEQELIEKYNYGPDHPQVRTIRKNIELTRELLLGQNETEPAPDFYQVYLASLREKINMNDQTIRKMNELFEKEQQSSRDLATFQVDDENFRAEIGRKERLFDAVLKRLEEINLVRDTGGARVELTHPPTYASQVRPDMRFILAVAGVLGLVTGLGLAFLIDTTDRRFRSPDEIRNDFGLPIFGHIPVIAEAVEKKRRWGSKKQAVAPGTLSPSLTVHHHPKGRIAEAYRGVRTALFFSTRVSGHKVIQITSPSPCDGKTTLSCNLAVSIANAGKRIVLIDADFRRSRVHNVFGIKAETGMSSVIDGTVELDDAIRGTAIKNLFILPCGPRPSNPAELLSSQRFEELIGVLREKFEMVLIDSPPVLAVSDPLNVAPVVDGVIMVMRLTKTARHTGQRALDVIDAVGANMLGIVVNGVGKTSGYGEGYGYGGYGYGRYGYDKAYSYSNRYTTGDDKSYYVDDDHTQVGSTGQHDGNGKT